MNTKLKKRILSVCFGITVFAGFAGTISGSLAWWAYSTRASIGFKGTSVASSEQLQIGLKTNVDMTSFGMTTSEDTPGYYFSAPGTGLQAETIAYYLAHEHTYAIDELIPVTSGYYAEGDTLRLKNSLVSGVRYNDQDADEKKYVHIPLAFRIMRYNAQNVLEPLLDESVWLSEAVAEASTVSDGAVYKAIRMYTVGYKQTRQINPQTQEEEIVSTPVKRLINPSSDEEGMGKTAVAGILDLSGSGYYDTYEVTNGEKPGNYTLVYGQVENDTASENDYVRQDVDTDSDLSNNFNNVTFISPEAIEASTFVAMYERGTYHPLNQAAIKPKYQNYDTLGSVAADDNSGILTGGKPLCYTSITADGIADLDLTIWLEGWDHNVIDKENRHSFNLGLQFMISRL